MWRDVPRCEKNTDSVTDIVLFGQSLQPPKMSGQAGIRNWESEPVRGQPREESFVLHLLASCAPQAAPPHTPFPPDQVPDGEAAAVWTWRRALPSRYMMCWPLQSHFLPFCSALRRLSSRHGINGSLVPWLPVVFNNERPQQETEWRGCLFSLFPSYQVVMVGHIPQGRPLLLAVTLTRLPPHPFKPGTVQASHPWEPGKLHHP